MLREKTLTERIAVIMGGKSGEREISLKTGRNFVDSLKRSGCTVASFDIDDQLIKNLQDFRTELVFIALHGKYGEDGTIQGMLEMMGLPYTGSGVLASALAMDKMMSKRIFAYENIPTPKGVCIHIRDLEKEDRRQIKERVLQKTGWPVVIKPLLEGSSLGVTILNDPDGFWKAVEKAFQYDQTVLVEQFISGVEITVGVLGNNEPRALPVIEIVPVLGGFYDYDSKYTIGGSDHIIPARIPQEVQDLASELAIHAHLVLGCRGYSRTDLIVDKEGVPFVLEVNTLPGMTETSLVPDAARAAGISFDELLLEIGRLALE
ncbi:MAG: D-alanine--D-alanine ligase family protein [Bacillota bacterium]